MKIIFFISVMGHGRGGHFHSLNHISNSLAKSNVIEIYTIGPGKSDVIRDNANFRKHLPFHGTNIIKLRKELIQIKKGEEFDIIHCFDLGSYLLIRLFFSLKKYNVFVNKCGGPNPASYPYIPNLVLFSLENLNWFQNQYKFRNSNINLIPNRVVAVSPYKGEEQKLERNNDLFTFVRICRVGKAYLKSIIDSINLISVLLNKNISNIRLLIIGTIEDYEIFDKFQENRFVKEGKIIFVFDEYSTKEASKMLYLADAVIGTGRGLMEAASLSIPILAINSQGELPVLLDKDNFKVAFETNFSERNVFEEKEVQKSLDLIIRIISDEIRYREQAFQAQNFFEHYFDIERVSNKYIEAYKKAILKKHNIFKDSIFILRTLYHFYLNGRK
ncbi:MAG: glycosyltransferase family 4 protein [Brumimicrobium sp.]|nr:glycosyltransferase family 4 protein [Brumimicrobium sp.]